MQLQSLLPANSIMHRSAVLVYFYLLLNHNQITAIKMHYSRPMRILTVESRLPDFHPASKKIAPYAKQSKSQKPGNCITLVDSSVARSQFIQVSRSFTISIKKVATFFIKPHLNNKSI